MFITHRACIMRHCFRPRYLVVFPVELALVSPTRASFLPIQNCIMWITVCRNLNAIRTSPVSITNRGFPRFPER